MKRINPKIAVLFLIAATATGLFSPTKMEAQNPIYGKGQGYADQIVLDRMYIRREKAKLAKRRAASKKQSRKGSKRTVAKKVKSAAIKPVATTQKVAPASYKYVKFARDSYQSFHSDDAKGYVMNFYFTPIGGAKAIVKSYNYTYYNSTAEFNGIPAGKYLVKAQVKYEGKNYPVTLGSEIGTPTNPSGGNFAPSMVIEVKPGIDAYSYKVLETVPSELYVRILE